ncbi:MAG: hypothetical protein HOI95_17380 [Chromatiales bacterium]|jgi:GTPase|nr:hypothetical protein [Chromatiales bacterium]
MRFESKPIEEHTEAPLADEGHFEALVQQWRKKALHNPSAEGQNTVFVASVGASNNQESRQAQLQEILSLVRAQGDRIAGHQIYQQRSISPKTFVGRGS